MFWKNPRRSSPRNGDVTAFVGDGTEVEGKLAFRGTVMLDGRFTGEITTTDTLIVGDKGVVKATVHVGVLVVSGEVAGAVTASERVEVRAGGRLYGDVETRVLVVEEGGTLEGQCRMRSARPAEPAAPVRDLSVVASKR
jgi:cytoskeletal protein CcmA (bactofilin family)